MMGPTHRVFGALCGATAASAAGQGWSMVAMTALVATATSHGWASPDVDQTRPWVWVRKVIPHPLDNALNHRALSHWWGLPVLAWWGAANLPPDAQWPAFALLIGWCSHLLGDLLFGQLPLLPWGGPPFGLGLDTNGFLESGKVNGRKVLPLSPTRLLITAALAWVLFAGTPTVSAVASTIERTLP